MKRLKDTIVFLDAGTVDYGDLSLDIFHQYGRFKPYFKTTAVEIVKRAANATILMTNKCRVDGAALKQLKHLRLVNIAATGTNNVDLEAARRLKIAVTNVSGYSTESVVQFTFAFLLALSGNLIGFDQAVKSRRWSRSPFFTLAAFPVREVHGKTLGIVGYGQIGKRVAEVAKSFGMRVLIARIPGMHYSTREHKRRASLKELLRRSDFVSLHAPLSEKTQHIINQKTLGYMKREAYLINMARGGLVNEKALHQALKKRKIAGAAMDVLSQEPPPANHPLLSAPRILMTPHISWGSKEARERLVQELALNIREFQAGKRRNRIV